MREEEIDLLELLKTVVHRKVPIILVAVVATILASIYCFCFMPDEYSATTSLYILNQQNKENISSSDLTASASLVNDYREIILSNRVTNMVEMDLGVENLDDFDITVESMNNTRIIQIEVTSGDAVKTAAVANSLATSFSEVVVDIMRVENVSIIDVAVIPEKPSGPAREKYIVLAALAAAVIAVAAVIVIELMNNSLKTAQDVENQTGLSVMAQFSTITDKHGRR